MGLKGQFLKKTEALYAELNQRAEALYAELKQRAEGATSRYYVVGNFLQLFN